MSHIGLDDSLVEKIKKNNEDTSCCCYNFYRDDKCFCCNQELEQCCCSVMNIDPELGYTKYGYVPGGRYPNINMTNYDMFIDKEYQCLTCCVPFMIILTITYLVGLIVSIIEKITILIVLFSFAFVLHLWLSYYELQSYLKVRCHIHPETNYPAECKKCRPTYEKWCIDPESPEELVYKKRKELGYKRGESVTQKQLRDMGMPAGMTPHEYELRLARDNQRRDNHRIQNLETEIINLRGVINNQPRRADSQTRPPPYADGPPSYENKDMQSTAI